MSQLLDSPAAVVEDLAWLVARATAAGLAVRAGAEWPETAADTELPQVPGFVVSTFNPLVAQVADRCLGRRPEADPPPVTSVVIVSALGDISSAEHVAETIDAGRRVGPLMFFQSVPNAIAGHVASRWALTGPVVSVGTVDDAMTIAGLLIADGDADEALVVRVELAGTLGPTPDLAVAVLVGAGDTTHHSEGGLR